MKQPDKDASPRNSATSLRRHAARFTAGRLARAAEGKTEGRASATGAVKELLQGNPAWRFGGGVAAWGG
jgi:hypothetical protein